MKRIPKSFKLFGTTWNVRVDDKHLNTVESYGQENYTTTEIILSTVSGMTELSEDRILDTYYHERTHAILDSMNERELSTNEKFVDVFSKLLRQADETAEYDHLNSVLP